MHMYMHSFLVILVVIIDVCVCVGMFVYNFRIAVDITLVLECNELECNTNPWNQCMLIKLLRVVFVRFRIVRIHFKATV